MSPHPPEAARPEVFRVVILMPVFRDWECAVLVCNRLDKEFARMASMEVRILMVDDGNPARPGSWSAGRLAKITHVESLNLRRNLGHQRAICVGLCHIHDHMSCDAVIVMDADGEDRPEDAVRLMEAAKSDLTRILFAERRKRQEGAVFRMGYFLYRAIHRILVGIPVRVGNFSVVPSAFLGRLTSMAELWNHFAGAVYKSKVPFECIPIDRGRRLMGRSQMDLAELVAHGIAGIATFQERVAARILISSAIALGLLSAAILVVAGIRLLTDWVIAGWATYTIGLLVVLFAQLCAMSFSLVFTLISNRSTMSFVPSRDYRVFVDRVDLLSRPE